MADAFPPRKMRSFQSLHKQVSQGEHLIKLHDHVVDCNMKLGVNLREDLSWKTQVDFTAAKASRTLGFLRRNLRDSSKDV